MSAEPQGTPTALPLRVLVKGASTVSWASHMGGPRTDFTFARALEEDLLQRDRPCEVRMSSIASELTKNILLTWQREVIQFSPDVIVLVYGHYETIHLFLPRWLERHANSLRARPRRLAQAYRQHLLRPLWMTLAKLQARVDSILDPTLRRGRPRRVADDLRAYIQQVQSIGSPMVLIFELLPPTRRYQSWFPGMSKRIEVMNRTLAGLVESIDLPHVRYFPVRPLVDEHYDGDLDAAIPDGFHYCPELHRIIGRELGTVVDEWASTQRHLTTPTR